MTNKRAQTNYSAKIYYLLLCHLVSAQKIKYLASTSENCSANEKIFCIVMQKQFSNF